MPLYYTGEENQKPIVVTRKSKQGVPMSVTAANLTNLPQMAMASPARVEISKSGTAAVGRLTNLINSINT